jgi:ubiquitin-protein ligase
MALYIKYRTFQPLYPGQPEQQIDGLHPATTFGELVKEICRKERKDQEITAHLYLPNGIPLNRNIASESWTLCDWQIEKGDLLLVIFCNTKYNGHDDLCLPVKNGNIADPNDGSCMVNIIGLKSCKIQIDQHQDNCMSLYGKVSSATNIPIDWMTLQYNGEDIEKSERPLRELDFHIKEFSKLLLILNPKPSNPFWYSLFNASKCKPLIAQSDVGLSAFYSVLFVISHYVSKNGIDLHVLGYLLHLTACPPLIHALAMLFDRRMITIAQKVAINEILYEVFKEMSPNSTPAKVFEESLKCWTAIFSNAELFLIKEDYENSMSFFCTSCSQRIHYPQSLDEKSEVVFCTNCIDKCTKSYHFNRKFAKYMIALPLEDDVCYWNLIPDERIWPIPMKPSTARGSFRVPDYLQIRKPNDLRLRPQVNLPPQLTQNTKQHTQSVITVIFTERAKQLDRGKTHYLLDPLTGKEDLYDLNMIDHSLQALATGGVYNRQSYITEPPDEAVLVVLDVSGSMGSQAYPQFTKLDVAKIIFTVFAERIMAFGFNFAIGLNTFTQYTTNICKLSTAGETFVTILTKEADKLRHGGGTRLWCALDQACKELDEIKRRYPKCIRRILCLTDGQDGNEAQRRSCVQVLCQSSIVMDCLLIGDNNPAAKAVAFATGGHAFYYRRIEDAMGLPDMEAFLSVRLRESVLNAGKAPRESHLARLQHKAYSLHIPVKINSEFCTLSTFPIEALKKIATQGSVPMRQGNQVKYVLKGLASMAKLPIHGINVFPIQQDVTFWKVVLTGPPNSPYEAGNFILNIHFPDDYPTSPPDIRFETKIIHCNVTEDGHICCYMLNRNYYSPDFTIREILKEIYDLLRAPEVVDLADGGRALDYRLNYREFNARAKEETQRKARTSLVTHCQSLTGMASPPTSDYDDIPPDAWFFLN